ncbi:hypothetical protein U0035_17515 [Niabella yanshanensis]|uniref:Lipoprotein n=1 Tax=Niabella yanshanensis TaxID=577386 RepID=A0ABZ0W2X0_9BACT|nr:hypothetical protein [Niabella yanshanensis]WQD37471.1 hypothetical protein U0035_17515 [Niabella yanshanensis]
MYYKAFVASLLLLVTLCAFRCDKDRDYIGDDIYTAEIKSINSCARYYACVITNGDIDPDLVDNSWKHDGNTYQKAFMVRNNCDFTSGIREGESFRFRIVKKPVKNDCIICNIAITGTPSKSLNIEVEP